MSAATALVTTTINVPTLLEAYVDDARAHGHDLKVIVAGDRKTPAAAAQLCADLERRTKVPCEYLDPAAQDRLLAPYPALKDALPWDCIQRRNVAVLKASLDGAATVITIDDDNLLGEPDFCGRHALVGTTATLPAHGTPGQWFNICDFLTTADGCRFVARGYGMAARADLGTPAGPGTGTPLELPVAVNAGLWLGDPDIDAVTRLAIAPDVTGHRLAGNFFVTPGSLTPFNSQNTALARRVLPAYFLSPTVGRFDDILASYIVKRVADHLGDGIAFGHPMVRQERNAHDLYRDLDAEVMGMRATDALTAALAAADLRATTYAACALELCDVVAAWLAATPGLAAADRDQLAGLVAGYRAWASLPAWT